MKPDPYSRAKRASGIAQYCGTLQRTRRAVKCRRHHRPGISDIPRPEVADFRANLLLRLLSSVDFRNENGCEDDRRISRFMKA